MTITRASMHTKAYERWQMEQNANRAREQRGESAHLAELQRAQAEEIARAGNEHAKQVMALIEGSVGRNIDTYA